MKPITLFLLSFLFAFLTCTAQVQQVPNSGFEDWYGNDLGVFLTGWNTSGNPSNQFLPDTANATQTTDKYEGNYAIKIQTITVNSDTALGYAIYGEINGDSTGGLTFSKGLPISGKPTSINGFFKYQFVAGDTGIVVVGLKQGGALIAQSFFPLSGTQGAYTQKNFSIDTNYAGVPDTIVVGFTSGNPDNPIPGSWVQVDSIWLGGVPDTIPNWRFENWDNLQTIEPESWISPNLFGVFAGDSICVRKTTDAHSGNYAMKIRTVDYSLIGQTLGFATAGNFPNNDGFTGGFAFNKVPTRLGGWYKYSPVGGDTAMVVAMASRYDPSGDSTIYVGYWSKQLTAAASYTRFEIEIMLDSSEVVDTVNIVVLSSKNFFSDNPGLVWEGSELTLDDLHLDYICGYADSINLITFSDTLICLGDSVFLNAGGGYNSYQWSTTATSQSISVNQTGQIWVNVTDVNQCAIDDTVEVNTQVCVGIPETDFPGNLTVYPNPANDFLRFKMQGDLEYDTCINLFGMDGRSSFQHTVQKGQNLSNFMIDTGDFSEGFYLLKISNEKNLLVTKIVIR